MGIGKPWITIIGIEEDGFSKLSDDVTDKINGAEVIVGGKRHLAMVKGVKADFLPWSVPFSDSIATIKKQAGKRVVVLASGDPQCFGVGTMLARNFPANELEIIPARGSFSLAASKLKWSLANVHTLTLHGRVFDNFARFISPDAKLLVLCQNGSTPELIATHLAECGFGQSKIAVLEHLGGDKERVRQCRAGSFNFDDIADLNLVGIECIAGANSNWQSRVPGLPDEAYQNDGQLTKSVVRAATLAALKPYPGALLWDVGAGCGSIGIEWMRAAENSRVIAIEPNAERCRIIAINAANLGVPGLKVVSGSAPGTLQDLPAPNAIFIGGGLTIRNVFETCWNALLPGGVLVANGVTLESDAMLFALHEKHGGTLARISVEQVSQMGSFRGWKQAKPVTQWRVLKQGDVI